MSSRFSESSWCMLWYLPLPISQFLYTGLLFLLVNLAYGLSCAALILSSSFFCFATLTSAWLPLLIGLDTSFSKAFRDIVKFLIPQIKTKLHLFIYCVCVYVCVYGGGIHVTVWAQFAEASSLLPCGSQWSNSGHQTWWQVPLLTEPFAPHPHSRQNLTV